MTTSSGMAPRERKAFQSPAGRPEFQFDAHTILGQAGPRPIPQTSVTISIGLAVTRGELDLSKIVRAADQALYVAKHRGRNRVAKSDAMTGSIAA